MHRDDEREAELPQLISALPIIIIINNDADFTWNFPDHPIICQCLLQFLIFCYLVLKVFGRSFVGKSSEIFMRSFTYLGLLFFNNNNTNMQQELNALNTINKCFHFPWLTREY